MRIVVFDDSFLEIASYPNHHSTYCRILRQSAAANEKCSLCDREACEISKKQKKTITYRCHAGMTEAVTPIQYENIVVGYVMLGQILETDNYEKSWKEILPYINQLDINCDELRSAYFKKKRFLNETIIAASKIMQACSGYLYLSKMIVLKDDNLAKKIDIYINSNLSKDLDVQTLCDRFSISKTRLYDIASHSYGTGIADHIRELRMKLAQQMLTDSDKKISEVAESCGFTDYNYFTKVFKKINGLTPREYRKTNL